MLAWHVALIEPNRGLVAERAVSAAGFTVFNPKVVVVKQWSRGRVRQSVKPYVPGYMFVRFDVDIEGWQRINYLPGSGVRSLMYAASECPAVVRDEALAPLLDLCADGYVVPEDVADAALIRVGQTARIVQGPLAGFKGVVKLVVGQRISMLVEIFGRDTQVTLERDMYEKVLA